MKSRFSQGNRTKHLWNFIQENEASWRPQQLCKLHSRRGKKFIFLSSSKKLLRAEEQPERQKVLGETMSLGAQKFRIPTADLAAEPIPIRRFGLNGFAQQLWMFKSH